MKLVWFWLIGVPVTVISLVAVSVLMRPVEVQAQTPISAPLSAPPSAEPNVDAAGAAVLAGGPRRQGD